MVINRELAEDSIRFNSSGFFLFLLSFAFQLKTNSAKSLWATETHGTGLQRRCIQCRIISHRAPPSNTSSEGGRTLRLLNGSNIVAEQMILWPLERGAGDDYVYATVSGRVSAKSMRILCN